MGENDNSLEKAFAELTADPEALAEIRKLESMIGDGLDQPRTARVLLPGYIEALKRMPPGNVQKDLDEIRGED